MKIRNIWVAILLLAGLRVASGMQSPSPSPTATASPTATPAPPEAPKAPQKLRVSSGVAQGQLIQDVPPAYPKEARKKHLQGEVVLQVEIDRSGNVTSVNVAKGDPILAEAAVSAVKQWKYRPYLLNDEPVELATTVKIQFHM